MTDKEKIIKGLKIHSADKPCNNCPYHNECNDGIGMNLLKDTLALLKEQDNEIDTLNTVVYGYERGLIKPKAAKPYEDTCQRGIWRCGNCHSIIGYVDYDKHDMDDFCRKCGRRIDWICTEFIHKKAMWEESEDETQESVAGDPAGADGVCAVVVRAAGG